MKKIFALMVVASLGVAIGCDKNASSKNSKTDATTGTNLVKTVVTDVKVTKEVIATVSVGKETNTINKTVVKTVEVPVENKKGPEVPIIPEPEKKKNDGK